MYGDALRQLPGKGRKTGVRSNYAMLTENGGIAYAYVIGKDTYCIVEGCDARQD